MIDYNCWVAEPTDKPDKTGKFSGLYCADCGIELMDIDKQCPRCGSTKTTKKKPPSKGAGFYCNIIRDKV